MCPPGKCRRYCSNSAKIPFFSCPSNIAFILLSAVVVGSFFNFPYVVLSSSNVVMFHYIYISLSRTTVHLSLSPGRMTMSSLMCSFFMAERFGGGDLAFARIPITFWRVAVAGQEVNSAHQKVMEILPNASKLLALAIGHWLLGYYSPKCNVYPT